MPVWLTQGAVSRQSSIVDRERTATFPLAFAEGVPGAEAMRFARLAAVFEPEWLGGAPSVEVLTVTPLELDSVKTAMRTRPLRVLTTLGELIKAPAPPRLRDVLQARVRDLTRGR